MSIETAPLAPHQRRVLDERRELAEKLGKLTAFQKTPIFEGLPLDDQGLLVEQAHHMTAYLGVLDARIRRFGETAWTDIGHGVSIEFREIDGVGKGVACRHPTPNGARCEGYAPLNPETPDGWDLIQREPLTIAPSLLCRGCGHHGFIRDGKWVPA